MALGALRIQKQYGYSDRELVEQITENPYYQYFIGLSGYQQEPPFVPSLLVEFRKRLPEETLDEINELIIQRNLPDDPGPGGTTGGGGQETDDGDQEPENKGTLILDATCAPQQIAYPQDINLLNEARENLEAIIDRIMKEHVIACNRIQRWLKIYFPEYVGMKKAMSLVEAAHNSVGIEGGNGARTELKLLIEDYRTKQTQLEKVTQSMTELTLQVPYAGKLLAIKGIGIVIVAGFLAEVGDIRRYESPKQIQKLAGLELVENSSGKKKGQTSISKRGRKKLRKLLFQVVLPLIAKNQEFGEIYDYYHDRLQNPLKGRQAMIAVSCKLIRVFYAILKKGTDYDAEKMLKDIRRPKAA